MTIENNQKSNKHNLFTIAGTAVMIALALYFGFTEGFSAAKAYFN